MHTDGLEGCLGVLWNGAKRKLGDTGHRRRQGGAFLDTYGQGGMTRGKNNNINRSKKTTKTTCITQPKYTVPKQCIFELRQ